MPFERVVVTGGAGFIGSHIVDRLLSRRCHVVVLDNLKSGDLRNLRKARTFDRFKFVKGDINDPGAVRRTFKDTEIIFHEAAITGIRGDSDDIENVNLKGTLNVLRCAEDVGVRKLVFASSAAIYGNAERIPLKESDVPSPISAYGRTKALGERSCLRFNKTRGLATTVLRYFNVYGPRSIQIQGGVINRFITQAVLSKPLTVYGNGKQTRDFVYVSDVVAASVMAASRNKANGEVFNVGTGKSIPINALGKLIGQFVLGYQHAISFNYKPARKDEILHSCSDKTFVKRVLGFSPEFSLEDGLKEYFHFLGARLPGGTRLS